MKLQNKWFIGAMLGAAVCLVSTSCVDEIKFGNSFLDKAPGGNATIDTVFNSAEYTRQFLNTCYSRQYYGLPYNTDSNGNIPDSSSPYLGKKDATTFGNTENVFMKSVHKLHYCEGFFPVDRLILYHTHQTGVA